MVIRRERRVKRNCVGQVDGISDDLGTTAFAARLKFEQGGHLKASLDWMGMKGGLIQSKGDLGHELDLSSYVGRATVTHPRGIRGRNRIQDKDLKDGTGI